jgi:hypothetical protein
MAQALKALTERKVMDKVVGKVVVKPSPALCCG